MNIPIKFPSEQETIAADVARFAALSPTERVEVIRGVIAAGALMMKVSPKAEFLRQYAIAQENIARQAVKEFIAHHGG